MTRHVRLALFPTVLSSITGSIAIAQPRAVDLSARRIELAQTNQTAATIARTDFIGAIAGLIGPQGFYVSAVSTLGRGPAAARAFLDRDSLNARSRAIITVMRLDVSADGNDGYSYGYLDLVRPNGDTLPSAFKAYWRRGADGRWTALAFGRGRREPGPIAPLPDSLRPTAKAYRAWPMRDSTEAWGTLKATEIAFSDASATDLRAAFMSFAAPDAGKIDSARYVFGPAAIGEQFRNPPPFFKGIMWHAEWGTVSGSNDLGFNVGPVLQKNPPPGSGPGGLFFTVWRRQADGTWKYLVD